MIFLKLYQYFKNKDNEYLIKEIAHHHSTQIMALYEQCEDYFLLHEGDLPENCDEFFNDLPPGKTKKDHHAIGVFHHHQLIAVVNLVEDFPEDREWIIGLMLLAPEYRKKGLGRKIHNILCQYAEFNDAKKMRIGVLKDNTLGYNFWAAIGYTQKEVKTIELNAQARQVIVMNYFLE